MRRLVPLILVLGLVTAVPVVSPVAPAEAGRRVTEKAVNLDIALRVAALLRKNGVPVVLTRSSDRTTSLGYRTSLANTRRVDAFVSVHNNSARWAAADWSEVYHQIADPDSRALGEAIRARLSAGLGGRSLLKTRRGDHGDYYHQLRTARMPAVLVEAAFLSNPHRARLLATPAYRASVARAIYEGIMSYQRTLRSRPAPEVATGPRVESPAVPPPAAARASVVNARTVRLTWSAPEVPVGDVLVYRDGTPVGQAPSGDGVFEDLWASPGQTYRYELRWGVRTPGGVTLESSPALTTARTPPITVAIDPGHGGRDPGATGTW